MSLRPKTVRRLAILSAATLVTAGTAGYVWHCERERGFAEIADARRSGFEALQHGRHEQAIADFRQYITAHPDDVSAVFALAQARLSVPEANNSHLGEARQLLLQVLSLEPSHNEARHQLMSLYARARFWKELQEQAEILLTQLPNDPDALRFRAIALSSQNRSSEAMNAWMTFVAANGDDILAQLETLSAMRKAGKTLDDLQTRANQLANDHTEDARFLIPLAWVSLERKETSKALELLDQVSLKATLDVELARVVLDQYDRAGEFDRANTLLERSGQLQNDPAFSALLVDRLFQRNRFELCIARVDSLASSMKDLPRNQSIKALSLRSLGKLDDARAVQASLASQTDSPDAQRWANVLNVQLDASIAPSQRLQTLRDAVIHWPEEGVLLAAYAQALATVNENAMSLLAWEDAARRAPAWPLPHLERSRLFLQMGQLDAARNSSSQALRRAPNDLASILQRLRVEMSLARSTTFGEDQKQLLGLIDQLKAVSETHFEISAYQIELFLRSGQREAAIGAAQALPANDVTLNRFTIESLASIGRIDHEVHDKLVSSMKSVSLSGNNIASIPLTYTSTLSGKLPADDQLLFDARMSTLQNESGAQATWRKLVDNAQSEVVLTAALAEGFDAMDQTTRSTLIERVKQITGPEAFNWRVAKMKWLLKSNTDQTIREAVSLGTDLVRAAPQLVEARLLFAAALFKTGNSTFALQHLREAVRLDPTNLRAVNDLVMAQVQSGTVGHNVTVLSALAEQSSIDPNRSIEIARLLLANGMQDVAQRFLTRAAGAFALDEAGTLILAELNLATNKIDDARRIYERLLDENPSYDARASAVIFFRNTGDTMRADAILSELTQLAPHDAHAAGALARVYLKSGKTDAARSQWKAAMALAPNDRVLAQRAVECEIESENYNSAATLAAQLLERFPSDSTLLRLRAKAQAMGTGVENVATLDRLIESLQNDPNSVDQIRALRAMSTLAHAQADDAAARSKAEAELAAALSTMARKNPQSLALQTRAIDALFTVGNRNEAAELAQLILTSKSSDASFVSLATHTLVRARMFPEARKAVQLWKKIGGVDPIEPDLILAEIQFWNAPAEALKTISPYAAQLTQAPDARPAALWLYASILVKNNRASEACAWLDHLLDRSTTARATAPLLARSIDDINAARSLLKRSGALTTDAEPATRFAIAGAWLSLAQQTGNASDAESALTLAAPEAARENASSNWMLASAEAQRIAGRNQDAEETLRRALLRYPGDSNLLNALAWLLYSTDRSGDEARNLAERAIQADSTSVSAYETAARIALAMNRTEDAERYFRRALALAENNIDALLGLATVQQTRGQHFAASQTVAKIEQIMSDPTVARRLSPQVVEEFNTLRSAMSSAN